MSEKINITIKSQHVGKALRKARQESYTGRTKLSELLNVSRSDIFKYELGIIKIPREILIKLFRNGIRNL